MLSNMREAHYFTVQRHTSEKLVLNLLWFMGCFTTHSGYVCMYLSLALSVFLSKISGIEKSYIDQHAQVRPYRYRWKLVGLQHHTYAYGHAFPE